MPVTEKDLARAQAGYLYLRDFECLASDDDLWPYDYDRHLEPEEAYLLAKACQIVHNGGCHTVDDKEWHTFYQAWKQAKKDNG